MQSLTVFLIVAVAAAYAAWLLMPQTLRRWLIGRLRVVVPSGHAWLARLEADAESSGCSSCKGCATVDDLGRGSRVARADRLQRRLHVPVRRAKLTTRPEWHRISRLS